ncbi:MULTISPECIES: hypothetical protein [Jeotgalibacillus]|uniref:hypothetical protein n=1 Tax=Jeotgalibacillus TaxID=157226 RepID=UPI0010690E22|nr:MULTISPECIES: hypothetical protein [Jeotgalibacillus]TFE00785.1 hypothetical protein E2491_04540 [Jeotgalibacillus sp. R-1-5s-1]
MNQHDSFYSYPVDYSRSFDQDAIRRPYYNRPPYWRPYYRPRPYWGVPFLGGLAGGLLATTLFPPYGYGYGYGGYPYW